MRISRHHAAGVALAAAFLAVSPPTQAVELSDRIDLHGYGYQDYMQATANSYLGADTHGSWDNNFLGLVMAATLTDKSKLWAQLETSSGEATRFTWVFVDYDLTDAARVHVGRVKFPLGFYNEIIDAKSLQPAALEPALYQGAADMVHDAYQGVGIDYESDYAFGHVLWQAYGGNAYDTDPPADSRDRRAFGGRITWRTPLDGLTLMGSAYRTEVQILATGAMTNEDRMIGSIGYATDALDIKAEYGRHRFQGVDSRVWYAQAAYALSPKWKPYVRYDDVDLDASVAGDLSNEQQTWVAGIGYRVNDAIGLKLENHASRGYALPVAEGSVLPGAGKRSWNLVVLAADFAF